MTALARVAALRVRFGTHAPPLLFSRWYARDQWALARLSIGSSSLFRPSNLRAPS